MKKNKPKYRKLPTIKHKIKETQNVKHKGHESNFHKKTMIKLFPWDLFS